MNDFVIILMDGKYLDIEILGRYITWPDNKVRRLKTVTEEKEIGKHILVPTLQIRMWWLTHAIEFSHSFESSFVSKEFWISVMWKAINLIHLTYSQVLKISWPFAVMQPCKYPFQYNLYPHLSPVPTPTSPLQIHTLTLVKLNFTLDPFNTHKGHVWDEWWPY